MTIREQSKLSILQYTLKVTFPESISAIHDSYEDAKPFLFNLLFVPILPIFAVVAAVHRRKKDRALVISDDKFKEKRKNENSTK